MLGWLKRQLGAVPRKPMTAVVRVTDGRRVFALLRPADGTMLDDTLTEHWRRQLLWLASGYGFISHPADWEVVITDTVPTYDPPTAGELGL